MPRVRQIIGTRLYLTPPLEEDAVAWATWLSDLHVAIPLDDAAYLPVSTESQRELILKPRVDCRLFTIMLAVGERPIGRGMLFNLDLINRTGELKLFIGDTNYWGHELGCEAIQLLLDYAFNLLNLNSVMGSAYAYNEPAIECFHRVGFRDIGRRRASRLIAGRAYDRVWMDILASEFESPYITHLMAEDA
ncbi:MAG: GNAT family protein [Anaerolineales bacterium]